MMPAAMRWATIALSFLAIGMTSTAGSQALPKTGKPTIYGYEVINTYPHDRGAFTQGLIYRDGFLFESTGMHGRSGLRKVVLETGAVIQQRSLDEKYWGEGLTDWNDKLVQITWRSQEGFVYDLATFEPRRVFGYPGEGWGLTHDGKRLIMSDGTPSLRFLNPETQEESGRVDVTLEGQPVPKLNELEMVRGQLFANIYLTNFIVMIDPEIGVISGVIDLTGLLKPEDIDGQTVDVLNGIAYDAAGDRLFVTGKLWPKLYEIRLVPKKP